MQLAMRLKTLFIRFYKSFNFDYIKKHTKNAKQKPWEMIGDKWYPYVQISIDPNITTIVGDNESGKSHLLSAIEKAISGEEIKLEDFCRYSQFFTVKQGEIKYPDFGCEWEQLSDEEQDKVRHLVSGITSETPFDSFFLFRTNKDTLTVYLQEGDKLTGYAVPKNSLDSFKKFLPHTFRIESDIALPDSVPIKRIIDKIPNFDAKKYEILEREQRQEVVRQMEELYRNKSQFQPQPSYTQVTQPESEFNKAISSIFKILDGSGMSLKEKENREKEIHLAYDLICKIAQIDQQYLLELANSMTSGKAGYTEAILKGINKKLEENLNFPGYWVQDRKFCLLLSARDHDLVFTIRDRTGTNYSFSERSTGLKYFLSYYIQYLAHEPQSKNPEILVMDEPDAYLSSQAQQDLLKIFDKFSNPDNEKPPIQVVYVTHSPFLIDKNHSERIRVLKKEEEGTRLIKDAARNHYEPLRSAFGAFLGETAFIGNCNLMVEGQGDQILIAGAAAYLCSCNVSKRETLDLNQITIVPAGGASQIPYLVYLARGRDVVQPAVIVLLDSDEGGNDAKKNLKRGGVKNKQLLPEDLILQIGDLANDSGLTLPPHGKLIEIEDLIPLAISVEAAQLYAKEVCEASESIIKKITEDSISKKLTASNTVFDAIESCFQEIFKDAPKLELKKVAFARSVIETIRKLSKEKSSQKGLKEFENNFKALFRRIYEMKNKAERDIKKERITQAIDRVIQNFLQDHPVTARREDAMDMLDEIEAMLDSNRKGDDKIKLEIDNIQTTYKLAHDMVKPIDNYEQFKEDIGKVKFAGIIDSQDEEEEE
ncbi:MAG: AAA family ATPase [Dolichospermum sp. OL03]|nr:AAA family ATPase [Dolichospermum sp. OL03]MCS6279180.1 AAA family ATPase [Dolichospermum sp.]